MPRSYTSLLLICLLYGTFSTCFAQDVTLNTQSQVDAFNSATTVINGNLLITHASGGNQIVNLTTLSNLTSVTGNMEIDHTDLVNLDDLINLTSIGGNMIIISNPELLHVDGLANLTTIGGGLSITSNYILTQIDGLANLSSLAGSLSIRDNDELTSTNFNSLNAIGDDLLLNGNEILTNLDGLTNLMSIGRDLKIENHLNLVNIDGLSNLSSNPRELLISNNLFLTNLDGLTGVASIEFNLTIQSNGSLIDIDGLSNLTEIGRNLLIIFNDLLLNVDGLSSLTTVGANFGIRANASIGNLNGLANLTSIGGGLSLNSNSSLMDCCAIQSLLSTPGAIQDDINIFSNPSECSSEVEILLATCLEIDTYPNVPCVGADNGSIQVQIKGGYSPLTYSWERLEDGQMGTGSSSELFFIIEDLSAGTYNIIVTDVLGNEFLQENIALVPMLGSVFEILEVVSTNSSNGFSNGMIQLTVSGGSSSHDISWSGTSSGSQVDVAGTTLIISQLSQGEYDIIVTDNGGNQLTVSVTLLDETVPVFPCTQPLDIVILNDVSGSVDAVEYEESKQFFVDFLSQANIGTGADDSRAAIIEWSDASSQFIQIPITGNLTTLQGYTIYDRVFDGGTHPHNALTFGRSYLASNARPDVERVLILSTDGEPTQISPSLIGLADQYKAAGYHIITIAFDSAFANSSTRDILRQVASIDLLAPGAPAYSLLDANLAEIIVNLYLCPIDPGSSATVYFDRDGAIDITGIETSGGCPDPYSIEITFDIAAFQELSIPPGTPVTFYYNNPALFGATPILTWLVPCAIPAGTTETFTVSLPVNGAANIFAVLNNDNSQAPPISFPITNIEELAYSNNISDTTICTGALPTLQAFKNSLTPTPICNNTVIYTVDVCNITELDASDVIITDEAPAEFLLLNSVVNNNGCASDNSGSFAIPAGCCVSITYTYDASNATNGSYNDQDVLLSGPSNQVYLDFEGENTAVEDVMIDGTIDCPSMIINFTKEVNLTNTCADGFVVYTFTIDNQLNIPLQGLTLTDLVPAPVSWVFQPYNLTGLSISNSSLEGSNATFIINEVAANTAASFSMDAYLGDWLTDGVLDNLATLENVPDLATGTLVTLNSNTVTTNVSALPEIEVIQSVDCSNNTISLTASLNGESSTAWSWVTTGDGAFSTSTAPSTLYAIGSEDLNRDTINLSITSNTDCGEVTHSLEVILEQPVPVPLVLETCIGTTIEYQGTVLSAGDTQDFLLQDSNNCDSIVSVTVIGLATSNEALTLGACAGTSVTYNGTTLAIDDNQDFFFQNSEGCDSVVNVMVIELPNSTEELELTSCAGAPIDYNGTTLYTGDLQTFTFVNSEGCDSAVVVTVTESPSSNETLALSTCKGEEVDYNGTLLIAGDTQTFTFLNSEGCDSTVVVNVVELPNSSETLILETCIGETIDFNGTSLAAGDLHEFVLPAANGCDSVLTVIVNALPNSDKEIILATCPGTPVNYQGITLSIGDQQTFVFENTLGCDSTITVTVSPQEGSGTIGFPNIFSPNADGGNDCLQSYFNSNLVFQEYKLQVFDRWGGLVFSTSDPFTCWDGKSRGKPCTIGVYVWFLETSTQYCEEKSVLKGDVMLIR